MLIKQGKKKKKKKKWREENLDVVVLWEGKVIKMRKGKSYQVMNKVRGRWEGICIKCISQHFSLPIFLSIWEDKKSGSERENFLSCFLSLLFSFLNQIVENNIFHSIFLFFLFSILLVFTPTKHTLRDQYSISPNEQCIELKIVYMYLIF